MTAEARPLGENSDMAIRIPAFFLGCHMAVRVDSDQRARLSISGLLNQAIFVGLFGCVLVTNHLCEQLTVSRFVLVPAQYRGLVAAESMLQFIVWFGALLLLWKLVLRFPIRVWARGCPNGHPWERRKPPLLRTIEGAFRGLLICPECASVFNRRLEPVTLTGTLDKSFMLQISGLCLLATVAGGYSGLLLAAKAWGYEGEIALENAVSQVLSNGYTFAVPTLPTPPADADNAAYWLRKIQPMLSQDWKFEGGAWSRLESGTLAQRDVAQFNFLLKRFDPVIGLARRAAEKNTAYWGEDWALPRFSESTWEARLAVLLAGQAVLDADRHKPSEAIADIRIGLAVTRALQSRSYWDGEYSAFIAQIVVLRAVPFVLAKVDPRAAQAAWEPLLNPDQPVKEFWRIVGIFEFAKKGTCEMLLSRIAQDNSTNASFDGFELASRHRAVLAELTALKKTPYRVAIGEFTRTRQQLARYALPFALLELQDAGLDMTYKAAYGASVRISLANAAVAAMEFRRSSGHWPNSWQELGAGSTETKTFRDPITGKELTMAHEAAALKICSAGVGGHGPTCCHLHP